MKLRHLKTYRQGWNRLFLDLNLHLSKNHLLVRLGSWIEKDFLLLIIGNPIGHPRTEMDRQGFEIFLCPMFQMKYLFTWEINQDTVTIIGLIVTKLQCPLEMVSHIVKDHKDLHTERVVLESGHHLETILIGTCLIEKALFVITHPIISVRQFLRFGLRVWIPVSNHHLSLILIIVMVLEMKTMLLGNIICALVLDLLMYETEVVQDEIQMWNKKDTGKEKAVNVIMKIETRIEPEK